MSGQQSPQAVELTHQAIKAFQLSIKLASSNFSREQDRDFIMKAVLSTYECGDDDV